MMYFKERDHLQCLSPSWCVMCKQDHESVLHLFLECDFAKLLWVKVFSEFGAPSVFPVNVLELLKVGSNARWSNQIKKIWLCVVWAVL